MITELPLEAAVLCAVFLGFLFDSIVQSALARTKSKNYDNENL